MSRKFALGGIPLLIFVWEIFVGMALGQTSSPALSTRSQTDSSQAGNKVLLDRFFLIRRSDYLPACEKFSSRQALVIFRNGVHPGTLTLGESFFVVTGSQHIVRARVKKIITDCESLSLISDGVRFGLLDLDTPIQWASAEQALLGVRGQRPLTRQIASITPIRDARARKYYFDFLRRYIAREEIIVPGYEFQTDLARITVGHSRPQYLFASIRHADENLYRTADDKVVRSTGFLLRSDKQAPSVLTQTDDWMTLLTATDLNGDGTLEFLVQSGGFARVSYEVWLFDGKHFTGEARTIYEWMH
jgi:hypothetical protein